MNLVSRSAAVLVALSGLSFPALARHEPETAASVLKQVRAAIGYDNLKKHSQGIEATGTAKVLTMDSTFSLIYSGDRAVVQRIDGPVSIVTAIDGDKVWVTDIGGESHPVFGADRDNAELGLSFITGGFLSDSSSLAFSLDTLNADAGTAILHFTRTGSPVTGSVTIDRATWLPSTWKYTTGPSESTVILADYRDFGGVKLPGSIATSSTSGAHISIKIADIKQAPTFIRSPYQMIDAPPADTAFDASISPEIEVVRAPTGHLLVHPTVNGKDIGWFIFDTGAGNMVLSTPEIAALGITPFGDIPATGVGGVCKASFCRPETLTLGPVTMSKPLMVGIDLSFLEQHMGRKVAGLIGYNLLARTTCRIDMATPAISIHDPETFKDPAVKWQALVLEQRIPGVEASFEGHKGLFKLDTGAAQMSVSMHQPAVDRLKLLDGRATTDSLAGGVGGVVKTKKGNLAWFELGGKRIENVAAEFAMESKGAFADPYTLGNIGGVLLKPFILVTDYRHNRIAFIERPVTK